MLTLSGRRRGGTAPLLVLSEPPAAAQQGKPIGPVTRLAQGGYYRTKGDNCIPAWPRMIFAG